MVAFRICFPFRCSRWASAARRAGFAAMAASTLGAVPPAAAGDYTTSATALLSPPIQAIDSAGSVPRPLSALDAARYRQIFRLQERGDWYAADRLISRLDDVRLLGHILA